MPASTPLETSLPRRTLVRSLASSGGGMILGFHLPGGPPTPPAKQDLRWG